MVAGNVAGIGVMEHLGLGGAQPLGGDHGGHNRPSAARLPDAQIEIARQVEVIVLADGVQRLVVFRRRLIVGVIVRKVGAGQNQRVGPRRQFRQRHAESAAGLVALVSHNHRHKLELS